MSRREILGALGAAGAASAAASFGTSAYFSDTESFEGNTLVAGTGELFVDWQQTVTQNEEQPVNAYPDLDRDGRQSIGNVIFAPQEGVATPPDIPDVSGDCSEETFGVRQGADEYCIEPLRGSASAEAFYDYLQGSSQNTAIQQDGTTRLLFYRQTTTDDTYLIIVNDRLNTGDGGEATLQFYGLDNATAQSDPWLLKDNPDDTYTTTQGAWSWPAGTTDGGVIGPLAPTVGEDRLCLRIVPDLPDTDLQILSGSTQAGIDLDPTASLTICDETGLQSGRNLPVPEVFQSQQAPEQQHLIEISDAKPGDSGQTVFSLHVSDIAVYLWFFAANYEANENGITDPEAAADDEDQVMTENGTLELKDPDPNAPGPTVELAHQLQVRFWYDEDCDGDYASDIETIIFEGSLADAMELFTQTNQDGIPGVPLDGDLTTPYDPIRNGTVDDGIDENRECFEPNRTVCIGVDWWLPKTATNAVQSDGVAFDLGFFVEQCTANNGSGLGPEE